MKKYILYPLFALLFALSFTACDKDDNNESVEINFSELQVTTTSKTANISIVSPHVIENGALQQVRSVGIRYHMVGSDEWINAAAVSTDPEHYVINLDGLVPNTEYEYIAWVATDTGTKFASAARFTTQDIALEANFGDMQLSLTGEGLRLSVASVKVLVDEKATDPDSFGAEYRAKGASQWIALTNATAGANGGFTINIPASDLTLDTTYEARAWIEVGGARVYSQRTAECFYEKSKLQDIMGEWRLAEWHDSADLPFAIYLAITADGKFTLWQQLQSVEWQKFTGTVELNDNVVTGVYSDGQAWSASYNVERDGEKMIWTAATDASDRSVYVPATIPNELSTMSISSATRSTERFL